MMYHKIILALILSLLMGCVSNINLQESVTPNQTTVGKNQQNLTDEKGGGEESILESTQVTDTITPLESPFNVEIEILATEFKILRVIKGHFAGGAWNDAVDTWEGSKHQIMQKLANELSNGSYSTSDILYLLDAPDQRVTVDDAIFELVRGQPLIPQSPPPKMDLLVYYWRGKHDFLYFVVDGETIKGHDWWFAGE